MSVGAHILLIVSISKDALIKWGIIIEGPLPSNCSLLYVLESVALLHEKSFFLRLCSEAASVETW